MRPPSRIQTVVITNFGRPDERRQTLTLRLDKVKDVVESGEVTIGGTTTEAGPGGPVHALWTVKLGGDPDAIGR